MKHMLNTKCTQKWCRGLYQETDIYCDWEGVLRCNKCKHTVPSFQSEEDEPKKKSRKKP